jgi:hypothetical protein
MHAVSYLMSEVFCIFGSMRENGGGPRNWAEFYVGKCGYSIEMHSPFYAEKSAEIFL